MKLAAPQIEATLGLFVELLDLDPWDCWDDELVSPLLYDPLYDPCPGLLDDQADEEEDCPFHDGVLACPVPVPPTPPPPKLMLLLASVL